jgi:hypothetical protein
MTAIFPRPLTIIVRLELRQFRNSKAQRLKNFPRLPDSEALPRWGWQAPKTKRADPQQPILASRIFKKAEFFKNFLKKRL